MRALPDCQATRTLRARFTGSEGLAIIEEWVDSVIGNEDRSECFGQTAVARAMRKLGVERHDSDDMLCDGELRLVEDRWIAYIRTGQPERRRRFTVAHELGHAALYSVDPRIDQGGPGVERVCNLFAAELLMPASLVRNIWRNGSDAEAIKTLAWRTASSLSASCVRLAEHVGTITTGLASTDGAIIEQYGANSGGDLQAIVSLVSRSARKGKASLRTPRGLTMSTQAVDGRIVFVAQRMAGNAPVPAGAEHA
jgi:Zn-dependent peptidase ImmA (M78 family)